MRRAKRPTDMHTSLGCSDLRHPVGRKTWSRDQRRFHWSPLAQTIYRRGMAFRSPRQTLTELKSIGLFWGGSTKYLRAQLSIAYAAGEMPFESHHFMSNGCSNVECRFEIFLRWIGRQWCEIIWFEIRALILHADLWPLNQRVQGSSPCAPTIEITQQFLLFEGSLVRLGTLELGDRRVGELGCSARQG
jgi:hypothetical protein